LESVREQYKAESAKRTELERLASSRKQELVAVKDRNVKLDRELNKALTDIKNLEWQNKQLESKQDKTIVEHVHVLEEAKRVTDRQLADAHIELEKMSTYIRSLEKVKVRLTGEAEDFARQTEQERVELRAKEKAFRTQEQKLVLALADVEKERRYREAGDMHVMRLQADLQNARQEIAEANQQTMNVQRSKENLETELTRLADATDTGSLAKIQRQYETKIAHLESQLEDGEFSKSAAARIKEYVDRQHAEIRRLIMTSGPKDESFRTRLLKELQLTDEELEREFIGRGQVRGSSDTRTMANVTPQKRSSHVNGTPRTRKDSQVESSRASDNQANVLRQQLQALELKMVASERVRKYLESSLLDLTAELENSDGSLQSLGQYRSRLSREKGRLAELLQDEVEARKAAEAAQIGGDQALWAKFQDTVTGERESYARLEESRKALVGTRLLVAPR
jgi:myosin heavy chain 9/10/11/14